MKVLFVRSYNHGVDYITQRQAQSLEEKGIQVVFYNIVGTGLKGYFKNIIPLRKLMQTEKPELIHAHYSLSGIVATLTFTSKPIVVSLMGSDVLSTNKLIFLFTRFLSKFFWSQTIVKSDEMYNVLANQKAIVIPNGVDLNTFKPRLIDETREKLNWSSSMFHVLFASDPNRPEKNYALAKAALDKVKEHIPSIEVHFLKGLNTLQMVDHYNAADLLLLTSNHEGSPNVIKEAMACNCPIVSTKVGDVANVINGTENSFLVNFKADVID
jgi:teichuronic acid biosynthesis glycosyltransferase TuaC